MLLKGKKIILGICGSIAAYKTAYLVRELLKQGAEVRAIMTNGAKNFITPLTISTLSKNQAIVDFAENEAVWNNHVELGIWADMLVIAPATANTISKMATGACDNMLLATYLSARCKVYVAPAMDMDMYKHPATQKNIRKLKECGNIIIEPTYGELASGLIGEGRMEEPEGIVNFLIGDIKKKLPLKGKCALVTAGPTYESIDPVRFIGNYSSGKMGYSIAQELVNKGAEVLLVSGPTFLPKPIGITKLIKVVSANEMLKACMTHSKKCDIIVMAAAVADFQPDKTEKKKIKKSVSLDQIKLKKTPDILGRLGEEKVKGQLLIGFALETDNEVENAKIKLNQKNLDMIVLNSLNDKGAGFGHDSNKITLIHKNNKILKFELKSKEEVAFDIVQQIIRYV